jgi:hypothetical protein
MHFKNVFQGLLEHTPAAVGLSQHQQSFIKAVECVFYFKPWSVLQQQANDIRTREYLVTSLNYLTNEPFIFEKRKNNFYELRVFSRPGRRARRRQKA